MNADLPIQLRDALAPWTAQLPPATDTDAYLARYHRHLHTGQHPAIAAVLAADDITFYAHRQDVA